MGPLLLLFSRYVMSDSFATSWTIAHQNPLSMGFLRQEYWNVLPFPSPGDLPDAGIEPVCPACQGHSLPPSLQGSPVWVHAAAAAAAAAKSLQSCPTLCNPIDSSPPGSPVPGILQARTLEWVAISFTRGSSLPRDRTQVSRIVGRCFTI